MTLGKSSGCNSVVPPGRRKWLRTDTGSSPDFPNIKVFLAGSYTSLGVAQSDLGDLEGADESNMKAIAIGANVVAAFPDRPAYVSALARSYGNLGDIRHRKGEYKDAVDCNQAVGSGSTLNSLTRNQMYSTIRTDWPDCTPTSASKRCATWGIENGAIEALSQSIAYRRNLVASQPNVFEYQLGLSFSYNNLGLVQRDHGDFTGAAESYRQAIGITARSGGDATQRSWVSGFVGS